MSPNESMFIGQMQLKYDISHYWYFSNKGFRFEPYVYNGCYDLMKRAINLNRAVIAAVKGRTSRIHF